MTPQDEKLLIQKALEQAKALASHSWEYGTVAEALLELHNPDMAVFGKNPFVRQGSGNKAAAGAGAAEIEALAYGKRYIRTDGGTLVDGEGMYVYSLLGIVHEVQTVLTSYAGSSGDPASLGITALLLGHLQQEQSYLDAAHRQLQTLLHQTPRFANGAISHREREAELWSDSVYMVPPFLAYYGRVSDKPEIMHEAARQCRLYHDVLADLQTGLWRHVVGPKHEDLGFWSTGIGWAAMGMTRVLATMIAEDDYAQQQQQQLIRYIKSLLDGVIRAGRGANGLVRNYVTEESSPYNFEENAGTAALASAIFRLAVLCPDIFDSDSDYIHWALEAREAVLRHVDQDSGIVSPVVNPMDPKDPQPARASAEAQCFVVLMYAAYRDWVTRRGETDV